MDPYNHIPSEPYKPPESELNDLPPPINIQYPATMSNLLSTTDNAIIEPLRQGNAPRAPSETDNLLRLSVEQNTRYREVLSERMTFCEEQSRTLREMVWEKFSFLEKEYTEMKMTLLEKSTHMAKENRQENRQSIDELKQRVDSLQTQISILPSVQDECQVIKTAVTAVEERIIVVDRDLEALRQELRSNMERTVTKSQLSNQKSDQDLNVDRLRGDVEQRHTQMVELVELLRNRLKAVEKQFEDNIQNRIQEQKDFKIELDLLQEEMGKNHQDIDRQIRLMDQTVAQGERYSTQVHTLREEVSTFRNDVEVCLKEAMGASSDIETLSKNFKKQIPILTDRIANTEIIQACASSKYEKTREELEKRLQDDVSRTQGENDKILKENKERTISVDDSLMKLSRTCSDITNTYRNELIQVQEGTQEKLQHYKLGKKTLKRRSSFKVIVKRWKNV